MMKSKLFTWIALLSITMVLGGACAQQQSPPPVTYSLAQLKYRLINNFDDLFYVDPDYWPVVREGQEEKNALEQFPIIKEDIGEFSAILNYLGMSNKSEYSTEEQLLIYRQHKKLTLGVQMTQTGDGYQFALRVREGQGESIQGMITIHGKITVLKREPSFNTYPRCLAKGTLIDTPRGLVPVEQLHQGMAVWTVDNSGKRVAGIITETSITPVPLSFQMLRIRLNDGRIISASPDHPTAVGRVLGEYLVGDYLDGALVVVIEYVTCNAGATYDLLPSGSTGFYWADGVLLMSTLATK